MLSEEDLLGDYVWSQCTELNSWQYYRKQEVSPIILYISKYVCCKSNVEKMQGTLSTSTNDCWMDSWTKLFYIIIINSTGENWVFANKNDEFFFFFFHFVVVDNKWRTSQILGKFLATEPSPLFLLFTMRWESHQIFQAGLKLTLKTRDAFKLILLLPQPSE